MSNDFIELNRTFHLSAATGAKDDNVDLTQPFGRHSQMTWANLLAHPRVVILAGGGSGKTVEIKNQAAQLHAQGRRAFFLRIEHVRDDFEGAFDKAAGDHRQFREWVASGDEGWIFLDSVDEARLRSVKEFEQAIRLIGRELESSLQRARIVITGREAAWRARSDRELIQNHLPYQGSSPTTVPDPTEALLEPPGDDKAAQDPEFEIDDDEPEAQSEANLESTAAAPPQNTDTNAVLIVCFDNLSEPQVEAFARAKGVSDIAGFLKAIDRKEAQAEITRPLDLEGLVHHWKKYGRIGSQLELTEENISQRLMEVDPDRAIKSGIAPKPSRQAACLLALGNSLMQAPEIRLPDALADFHGVDPRELLNNWREEDIRNLLLRPLFVASQFGSVRLHAQKVREFLTAEWFYNRLKDHASRARIESLFFRVQYGQEVVVPTLRGVLPWLALRDQDILARVRRIAPEVMFEGGDPSRLPLEVRRDLLKGACAQLAGKPGRSSLSDLQAIRRFAAPDLANTVKELLATYRDNDEVLHFLMRMVWQGEISEMLNEAKSIATSATNFGARLVALRVVGAFGTETDRAEVRASLLNKKPPPERQWLAEAVDTLPADASGVTWLLEACVRGRPESPGHFDSLSDAITSYAAKLPLDELPRLVEGIQEMLAKGAVGDVDEDGDDGLGQRNYDWLWGVAISILTRLVKAEHESAFAPASLQLLLRFPRSVRFGDSELRKAGALLSDHVAAWAELNRALFWADVHATRARQKTPLVDVWPVGNFGHCWRLTNRDFDYFGSQIETNPLLDDRQVALSVAHALYRENGRPQAWRQRLHRRVKGTPILEAALSDALHPKSDQLAKYRRQEAKWKRREARDKARQAVNRELWRQNLQSHVESLRTPLSGGAVRNNQYYLYNRLRELAKGTSRWASGRWQQLIPEFGVEVAEAFRDGAIKFWRINTPQTQSTSAKPDSTPISTVFGLTGLLFESQENRDWAARLTPDEAEIASRYAVNELNGFPQWFPQLFAKHPDAVARIVLGEIDHELRTATDQPSHYVLNDVSTVGGWLRDRLAPEILKRLTPSPVSPAHLNDALSIVAGSKVDDSDISALASRNATVGANEISSIWFAAWIGVDPAQALPALTQHLSSLQDRARQTDLAMRCLVALTGSRGQRSVARERFRTVAHLKALFFLMHEYIVDSEDIDRFGGGVYSPTLRDEAQESRDALLIALRDTPGQESYFALRQIADQHPSGRARSWAARIAQARAVADSAELGWSLGQVCEFQEQLERTPRNHQELHELAIERLNDFKHFLEHGETSIAEVLLTPDEPAVRNVVANWCKDHASSRYAIGQEEEFADKKRTDIRFLSTTFDNPVPVELKLANLWRGTQLAERLENQLCNDYLRDNRCSRGIFLLVAQANRSWTMPDGKRVSGVAALAEALQSHWASVASRFPHVESVRVIGIDLTKRAEPQGRSATPKRKTATTKRPRTKPAKPRSARDGRAGSKAAKKVSRYKAGGRGSTRKAAGRKGKTSARRTASPPKRSGKTLAAAKRQATRSPAKAILGSKR